SGSGNAASASRIESPSASQPVHRKRDAPLTSVPRRSSSWTRVSSLPVTASICSISSRIAISRTTTGVIEIDSAASELSLTRILAGRDMQSKVHFHASIMSVTHLEKVQAELRRYEHALMEFSARENAGGVELVIQIKDHGLGLHTYYAPIHAR